MFPFTNLTNGSMCFDRCRDTSLRVIFVQDNSPPIKITPPIPTPEISLPRSVAFFHSSSLSHVLPSYNHLPSRAVCLSKQITPLHPSLHATDLPKSSLSHNLSLKTHSLSNNFLRNIFAYFPTIFFFTQLAYPSIFPPTSPKYLLFHTSSLPSHTTDLQYLPPYITCLPNIFPLVQLHASPKSSLPYNLLPHIQAYIILPIQLTISSIFPLIQLTSQNVVFPLIQHASKTVFPPTQSVSHSPCIGEEGVSGRGGHDTRSCWLGVIWGRNFILPSKNIILGGNSGG